MTLTEFLAARLDEASAAIARWGDPEAKRQDDLGVVRSLRQVEAMRLLLTDHGDRHVCEDGMTGGFWCDDTDQGLVENPCAVLRIIATIWSDHPDYKDSWKVGE